MNNSLLDLCKSQLNSFFRKNGWRICTLLTIATLTISLVLGAPVALPNRLATPVAAEDLPTNTPTAMAPGPEWVDPNACETSPDVRTYWDKRVMFFVRTNGGCNLKLVEYSISSGGHIETGSKVLSESDLTQAFESTWEWLQDGDVVSVEYTVDGESRPGGNSVYHADIGPAHAWWEPMPDDNGQACKFRWQGQFDPRMVGTANGQFVFEETHEESPWITGIYSFPNDKEVYFDLVTYAPDGRENGRFHQNPVVNPCYQPPTETPTTTSTATNTPTNTSTPTTTATNTPTNTPTNTATSTPTSTGTITPTATPAPACVSLEVGYDRGDNVIYLTVIGSGNLVKIYRLETNQVVDQGPFDGETFYGYDPDTSPGVHTYQVTIDGVFFYLCKGRIEMQGTPTPTPTNTPTSTPTDTPTTTPTDTPTATPVSVTAAPTQAPSRCPQEPVLRETIVDGQWEIYWWNFDEVSGNLVFVKNLTAGQKFDINFRNPSVRKDNCAFTVQVEVESGWETRVYSFNMTLLGTVPGSNTEPEFVPTVNDPIVAVDSQGILILADYRTGITSTLGIEGNYPHALVLVDGKYRIAYKDQTGNLAVLDENQVIVSISQKCDRPEWVPDGSGIYCREDSNLKLFSYPNGEVLEVYVGFFGIAVDPDNSGRAVVSGVEFVYTQDIEATKVITSELNSDMGWGSDWGDRQITPDEQPFELFVKNVTEVDSIDQPDPEKIQVTQNPSCAGYEGTSIVECLTQAGADSSFTARAQLALANGLVDSLDEYDPATNAGINTTLLVILQGN